LAWAGIVVVAYAAFFHVFDEISVFVQMRDTGAEIRMVAVETECGERMDQNEKPYCVTH
jgi:hypothetical protein